MQSKAQSGIYHAGRAFCCKWLPELDLQSLQWQAHVDLLRPMLSHLLGGPPTRCRTRQRMRGNSSTMWVVRHAGEGWSVSGFESKSWPLYGGPQVRGDCGEVGLDCFVARASEVEAPAQTTLLRSRE